MSVGALVKLLYDNKSLSGTWTASTEVATLPVTNLASSVRREPWRTTSAAAQWAKGYFAGGITIGGFAIVSGNLTTAASVTLKGNNSDSWGSPGVTLALTPWSATLSEVILAFFGAAQTYPWWRLDVDDPTNPAGYIEIGALPLSPVAAFTRGANGLRYRRQNLSARKYSIGGTPYTTARPTYTLVDLQQPTIYDTLLFGDLVAAVDALQARDGVMSVISGDPSGAASTMAKALNLYGQLETSPDFEWAGPAGLFRGKLTFRESL